MSTPTPLRAAAATAFATASIGNVGPGFDVLGLAVDGIGDSVTVELLAAGPSRVEPATGRDAGLVPRDPDSNCAAIAARALLRGRGLPDHVAVTIQKGLALAGGMGGSAASSVAGAFAAHLAAVHGEGSAGAAATPATDPTLAAEIMTAALAGEEVVSGRHLDNIAPQVLGGLALSRSVDPIDAVRLPVAEGWWVALVTPQVRIETKAARALLPAVLPRAAWIQQMANTVALAHALAVGDAALLGRALDDRHAEPLRGPLIPRFAEVKAAALAGGAAGCSISGSGPTVFAIALGEDAARGAAAAMQRAFGDVPSAVHVGAVARRGVRVAETPAWS